MSPVGSGKDAVRALASPKTLVDQAYSTLLDAICDGTLSPGERLTQADVAKRLKVSRQPVHNALLVLKAQGFVRATGRCGLAVAPIDHQQFHSIYEFRSAIEPLAVRLAAARATPAAIAAGRALVAEGEAVARRKDIRGMIECDMNFHLFLYDLSGNSLIIDSMRLNWQHLRRTMGAVLQLEKISTRVWHEHSSIIDALSEHNIETAVARMEAHIVRAHADMSAFL
ncbi:MAG: GntR family transcriptional regulator [Alphaproteobacteria bacterium]|nr:GntR family transcriptional regulator [Alphaproteobacteria bacterium]